MNFQKLLSYTRRACADYDMIDAGGHIIAAVSGGKDSLTMLAALAALRRFYPRPFTLSAVTVDLGLPDFDTEPLRRYCESLDVPYTVVKTDIAKVVFDERAEKNPCSLCAKMRKGALNAEALKRGASRVAYGHNKDDIIHTFLMSLFYEGRLHAPEPVSYLDRSGLYCIRPLLYVPERDVVSFARREGLPVIKSPCPADGTTKRAETAAFTAELRKRYANLDAKLFTALRALYK